MKVRGHTAPVLHHRLFQPFPMTLREIQGTGIRVSPLGLGTVKFGRNEQVKYPRPFDLPSDADIHRLLDVAREGGINFLDTAPAYGVSEERLGRILADRPGEDWVLGTKAGEEFVDGGSRFDFSPASVRASVERSLRRLGRDRLDLFLLHSNGDDEVILRESGVVEVLFRLREEGTIRAAGISTKTVDGGCLAFELGLDVVMASYSPWHRDEEPVLDAAAKAGRRVLVKKALGSGWLGNGGTRSPRERVRESLALSLAHPGVASIVVGTLNPENLRGNCAMVRELTG